MPRVLIIGGGLGGLALAQALRRENIPYDLFERDTSGESRAQGWAISLHSWMRKAFEHGMSNDMPPLEPIGTTYALGVKGQGAIFSATDMHEHARFGYGSGVDEDMIRANRAKLREWLLTNTSVRWNKRFTHYEQDNSGVTAFFEDGSSFRGDILVGADGISSRVRDQLLQDPDLGPKHLPMGIIVGELVATREQYERWMKIAPSFFIGIAGHRRIFVGLRSIAPDLKTAIYYWVHGWKDNKAAEENFWTASASKEEMHSFVMNDLKGVHSDFTEILRASPKEEILHPPILMRDMTPPELPRGRVTLLGDAVHPMVPFRGEGGNMAMNDGLSIAHCIATSDGKDVEDILKDYEAEMTPRTTQSVLASRKAGMDDVEG